METVLHALKHTMEEPAALGAFHIVSIVAIIVITAVLCVFFRNATNNTYRCILVTVWAILTIMELIKQLTKAYYFADDGSIVWEYDWSAFPLQLCSFPLYVLLPIAFLKDGKVRDALSAFSYTYILLGGLVVLIVPSSVFSVRIYQNIQTMVHHGLQIASCIYIAVYNRKRITFRAFLYGAATFVVAVIIATLFNVATHAAFPDQRTNMFFISPYFKRSIPVFNDAWQQLHWLPTILLYIAALSVAAFVIFMVFYGIARLVTRHSQTDNDTPVSNETLQ